MKTNEWFICLVYRNYNFLIPHYFGTEDTSKADLEIDFDAVVKDLFCIEEDHTAPAAITVNEDKKARIITSAIPSVYQASLKDFYVPQGILEQYAKNTGIIALSFKKEKVFMIVNPELLYRRWSAGK
ncbi:MAG: hypothetical protein SPJ89_08350 [Treponema sp.]|nr:hypothetical protein [Spirochaetia bacterium]MDD7458841.1 hypothetical protein [Spirochaetales bacterium]MDY5811974.1 hypothetical protein [Treponema sp.]